jgi:hypothetical protein
MLRQEELMVQQQHILEGYRIKITVMSWCMFFADSYIDPGTELILGVEGKVVDVFVMP